eukprot:CAMPEP_0168619778 /NCGR_PEP_ID=MMETSP0449_2-20121227/6784_1 /TAXON_ID=1082188 /ORGANISM="Strombidium rassoulzadegani, Strain ras09" /LENGTH=79 /DNA_ID=CAMNT_0008660737 /DNA_START=546 /DNA_END=785 /DNA_ORIENTATION=-
MAFEELIIGQLVLGGDIGQLKSEVGDEAAEGEEVEEDHGDDHEVVLLNYQLGHSLPRVGLPVHHVNRLVLAEVGGMHER